MTLNDLELTIPGRDAHHVFRLYMNNVDHVTLSFVLSAQLKGGGPLFIRLCVHYSSQRAVIICTSTCTVSTKDTQMVCICYNV